MCLIQAGIDGRIDTKSQSLENLVGLCLKIYTVCNSVIDPAVSSDSGSPQPAASTVPAAPAVYTSSSNDKTTTMDLSGVDPYQARCLGPITAEEKARRISSNLCLCCGDPSHQVDSCPKFRARNQGQG